MVEVGALSLIAAGQFGATANHVHVGIKAALNSSRYTLLPSRDCPVILSMPCVGVASITLAPTHGASE